MPRRTLCELLEPRLVLSSVYLSIPNNLSAARGAVVAVPVNINQLTDGGSLSGLSKADFAIDFDPSVFTVSSSDVFLGTVPASGNNWVVTAVNQAAGQLGISIKSAIPLSNSLGIQMPSWSVGGVIDVDFHVQAGAPLGTTVINLAASNSAGPTTTDAFDASGSAYTLSPAPTNGGSDPNVDGAVNIVSAAPPLGTWSGDPGPARTSRH